MLQLLIYIIKLLIYFYSKFNYRQDCAKHSHAGIVFTQRSKNRVFAPQGRYVAPRRYVAPINVKFGTG